MEFAAAVAATLAPAAAQSCTQDCIQVHGGIGFTWEHDTNIYYRRALGLVAAFGRAADYPQRVVDTATTTGVRKLNIDLDPEHREDARGDPRGSRCTQSDSVRSAHNGDRRGWLGDAVSAQAVGTFSHPGRADHHRAGIQRRQGSAPHAGHRKLSGSIHRRVRQ